MAKLATVQRRSAADDQVDVGIHAPDEIVEPSRLQRDGLEAGESVNVVDVAADLERLEAGKGGREDDIGLADQPYRVVALAAGDPLHVADRLPRAVDVDIVARAEVDRVQLGIEQAG